jgi:hypothetical protein
MKETKEEIFKALKPLLEKSFPSGRFVSEKPGRFDVYGKKKVTVGKKLFDGMYFASLIIQKNFVGFYFFPIYTHPHEFKELAPELKKCLKGKSCFHITKHDEKLFSQIKDMLKKGIQIYKKEKWV